MPENDQYPTEVHGTKLPVALTLAAAITIAVGVFAFANSRDAADPTMTGGIPPRLGQAAPAAIAKPAPSSP